MSPHRVLQKFFTYPSSRLGYRGSILLSLGLAWVLIGVRVLVEPSLSPPQYIHEILPEWLRASMWIGTGVLGVIAAYRRGPGDDWFGFAALVLPLIVRAVSYTWGTFTWIISVAFTDETLGAPLAFMSAVLWVVLAVIVLTCAGWPEPPRNLTEASS